MNVTDLHLYSTLDVSGTPYKHLEFSFTSPNISSSYIITNATGLDLDTIYATMYNAYNSTTVRNFRLFSPTRVVSLLISFNPQYSANETVADLRDNIYKLIAYTRNSLLEMRFMNGETELASLYGRLTKVESPLFTSHSQIQLTFECDFPLLTSRNYISVSSPAKPTPSWTDALSTAPHGYKLAIDITGTVPAQFTIQGIAGSTEANFVIDYQLVSGDTLYLSSEENDRYLYRVRSGVTLHLLDKVAFSSVWPLMYPGSNSITLPSSNFDWVELKYKATYWGV